ncbi:MAG: PIN domain-containing protein [Infirmifilum sp.]
MIDTYAWVEFFAGSERGEKVKKVIAESTEVMIPNIVLAELARKYLREGMDEGAVRQRVSWVAEIARTIPIDEEVALLSGKAYLELQEKAKKGGAAQPQPSGWHSPCRRQVAGRKGSHGGRPLQGLEGGHLGRGLASTSASLVGSSPESFIPT